MRIRVRFAACFGLALIVGSQVNRWTRAGLVTRRSYQEEEETTK